MNPRTMPVWPPVWRTLALAVLLGALCTLGFAPFAVSPAPTFSLAGLLLLWQRAATPRQAALLGLAWGMGCFLTGVSWVYVSLSEFGGMAMPLAALATFLLCLLLALFPALAGGLFARWRSSTARDIWLFAGLWTLSEWLRGTVLTGFPWLAIGYSQSPPSPLAGWGAVLGVYGVGFSVALIGGLITSLFAKGWKKVLSRHGTQTLAGYHPAARRRRIAAPDGLDATRRRAAQSRPAARQCTAELEMGSAKPGLVDRHVSAIGARTSG